MPDAAPNGANQRRTTNHCTNATAARTTAEGVPAWMPGHYGNALLTRLPVRAVRRHDLSVSGREPRGRNLIGVDAVGKLRVFAVDVAGVERGDIGFGQRLVDLRDRVACAIVRAGVDNVFECQRVENGACFRVRNCGRRCCDSSTPTAPISPRR